jgi:hypothetical protein
MARVSRKINIEHEFEPYQVWSLTGLLLLRRLVRPYLVVYLKSNLLTKTIKRTLDTLLSLAKCIGQGACQFLTLWPCSMTLWTSSGTSPLPQHSSGRPVRLIPGGQFFTQNQQKHQMLTSHPMQHPSHRHTCANPEWLYPAKPLFILLSLSHCLSVVVALMSPSRLVATLCHPLPFLFCIAVENAVIRGSHLARQDDIFSLHL